MHLFNRAPASAILLCMLLGTAGAGPAYEAFVRADPEAAPSRDGPASVRVLGRDELLGSGPRRSLSLSGALDGVPGVRVASAGGLGQYSALSLRGAEPAQVLVLLDGVPLNGGAQGAVDLSQLPIEGLERVEIYRGLPPLEFGPDAIGGAINLVSRRGRQGRRADLLSAAGSFGLRRLGVSLSTQEDRLRVAATASYQGAQGDFPYFYATAGGRLLGARRENDAFDQAAAQVLLGRPFGPWDAHLQGQAFFKRQGVPAIGFFGAEFRHADLTVGRALLEGGAHRDLLGDRLTVQATAHALFLAHQARAPDNFPPESTETTSEEAGAQVVARARVLRSRGLYLKGLAELRYEALQSHNLCPAPGSCPGGPTGSERLRAAAALGAEVRLWGDRLLLQPEVHALLASSRLQPLAGTVAAMHGADAAHSRLDGFVSPRLLLRLRAAPSLILRASAGRLARLPTFLELFGDGVLFQASPDLRPESAWVFEIGLRAERRLGRLRLAGEAHGFARLAQDLIVISANGPRLISLNVGAARVLSAETEISAQLADHGGVRLSYTLLDGRNQSGQPGTDGNLLPGRPLHSVLLRLDGGFRCWRAFYELDHASQLYLDPGNQVPRPPRTLHAIGAQVGPVTAARAALAVELYNLLDTRVLQPPPTQTGAADPLPLADYHDFPLPGRSLLVTLSANL